MGYLPYDGRGSPVTMEGAICKHHHPDHPLLWVGDGSASPRAGKCRPPRECHPQAKGLRAIPPTCLVESFSSSIYAGDDREKCENTPTKIRQTPKFHAANLMFHRKIARNFRAHFPLLVPNAHQGFASTPGRPKGAQGGPVVPNRSEHHGCPFHDVVLQRRCTDACAWLAWP